VSKNPCLFTLLMTGNHCTSMKSSAKSSCSSCRSSASTSSKHSIKRVNQDAIIRPLKRAKHTLSNVSSPVISDVEDDPIEANEQSSVIESLDVIEVDSEGEELDRLEKELGMPALSLFF
jgi:hypothetical protein